ncbi:MAG: Rpn family recombination-promoting nuclease/putative transposase, partial [Spirochaetaceae bacterium]|nr:Rpn family recombination-promoting nuclease/putative transposase [Spirochaetaceae bacterium]
IFICTFDPFHCGKAMYHFANYCINHDFPIPLEDGTSKLFLNTAAKALDSLDGDLRLFYDYVRERTAQTTFTKELDSSISKLKQEKEERSMYLTYTSRMMECRQDGYEEGLHTGREEGAYQKALETARNLLSMGLEPEQVAQGTGLSLEVILQLID